MPPSNDTKGSNTPLHKRKQSGPARIVPAIPLALSKPKASRSHVPTANGGRVDTPASNTQNGSARGVDDESRKATPGRTPPPMTAERPSSGKPASVGDDQVPSIDTPVSRGSAPMSVSTGDTPDLFSSDSMEVKTPPQALDSSPTVIMSPLSSRKPTDRFDMSHIKTELPPAFVPSTDHETPQSGTSSIPRNAPEFSHGHPSRPSTSSIVFGGLDSMTSSPAPPQSAGSGFQAPQYPSMPQPPYYMPSGHAHHASEPHGQRMYHPGFSQPFVPWNMRQGHMPPPPLPMYHPHAHMALRYPPRDTFTPHEAQTNGIHARSRSASQSSSAAVKPVDDLQRSSLAEQKAASAVQRSHRYHHTNGHIEMPPPMPHPDLTANFQNAEAMRDHVLSHFSHPALADCHLQIMEDEGAKQYLDGHQLILSRSPTLWDLIRDSEPPASATLKLQVHVQLNGRYVRSGSLLECLKYLYGGPLLPLDHSRWAESAEVSTEQRMETALQYIATGAWLKIPAVALRGVDVVAGLLNWDTLPSALGFALQGGLSQVWTVDDGSEDKFSCASSDDSLGRESAPTYDPYATQLLHRVLSFTVHMFPQNFYLDASAPQLEACPRLPAAPLGHESKPSRSDPRLSQIRFGEMSLEDHRPSPITTAVSSMLLSLPFALLKFLLEHPNLVARLGTDTVGSIMRQVVAEREVCSLQLCCKFETLTNCTSFLC